MTGGNERPAVELMGVVDRLLEAFFVALGIGGLDIRFVVLSKLKRNLKSKESQL